MCHMCITPVIHVFDTRDTSVQHIHVVHCRTTSVIQVYILTCLASVEIKVKPREYGYV